MEEVARSHQQQQLSKSNTNTHNFEWFQEKQDLQRQINQLSEMNTSLRKSLEIAQSKPPPSSTMGEASNTGDNTNDLYEIIFLRKQTKELMGANSKLKADQLSVLQECHTYKSEVTNLQLTKGDLEIQLKEKEQRVLNLEQELMLTKNKIQQLSAANQYHASQFFNTLMEQNSATTVMRLREEKDELEHRLHKFQDEIDKMKKEKTLTESMKRPMTFGHSTHHPTFADTFEPLDMTEDDLTVPIQVVAPPPPKQPVVVRAKAGVVKSHHRESTENGVLSVGGVPLQRKPSTESLATKTNLIQKMNPVERRKFLNSQIAAKKTKI